MSGEQRYTVKKTCRHEIKVKGSTFIGSLSAARDKEGAETFINQVREEFSDATHNCFAYRIDRDNFRYYDDGEPSSTAGRPILSVLDKYLINGTLVVTRYFGGTRLGVGGLIQAYSGCAEETVQHAELAEIIEYRQFNISYPYNLSRLFYYTVEKYNVAIIKTTFDSGVASRIRIAADHYDAFAGELLAPAAGRIQIDEIID